MLSGQRNKYKLSNANTAFIHQKHPKVSLLIIERKEKKILKINKRGGGGGGLGGLA